MLPVRVYQFAKAVRCCPDTDTVGFTVLALACHQSSAFHLQPPGLHAYFGSSVPEVAQGLGLTPTGQHYWQHLSRRVWTKAGTSEKGLDMVVSAGYSRFGNSGGWFSSLAF